MINLPTINSYGGFGNQLFQYAFAHFFCEQNKYELNTPHWIGQDIFNIQNRLIASASHRLKEDQIPPADNYDILGYFQNKEHLIFYNRDKAKDLYSFTDKYKNILYEKQPTKDFYIACHIRRGDYGNKYSHVFALIEERYYIDKVEELGYSYNDILWIREETAAHNPKLPPKYRFLQDFWNIMNAPIILRSNSTFSWWAGTLADHDQIYAPLVEGKTGWHKETPFVHGNWPSCVHKNDLYLEGNP